MWCPFVMAACSNHVSVTFYNGIVSVFELGYFLVLERVVSLWLIE